MSRFLNRKYRGFQAYVPGEQPTDKKYIKLNTNESPFPPAEAVCELAKSEIADLRLYPDPECSRLKRKIASHYSVEQENIYVANGSDDILNFAFMAFCGDGTKAVFPQITYGFYKVFAELNGVDYEEIPLKKGFAVDYADFCSKNAMIVLANPNAPTGLTIPLKEIEEILRTNPRNVVLIDEAYIDFGAESCYNMIDKYDNLLVVQTFSKSRSMAGARLGFAIASKGIIEDLEKIKYSTNPYNINRLTQVLGAATIDACEYYKKMCKEIILNRRYTMAELEKLGFTMTNSKANFLFAKHETLSGEEVYERLKEQGILVRHFSDALIRDYNRITIGTREEMRTLVKTLKEIVGETNENK